MLRSIDVAAHAGTAFDGKHLFQIAEDVIQKIDPEDRPRARHHPGARQWRRFRPRLGRRVALGRRISRRARSIRSTPRPGKILRTIESNRFVTGVTWVDGELWHGTWEGDESDVRRIDPETGEVLEKLDMPAGMGVSGLESDGGDRLFCGGGNSGKVRAIRRPGRASGRSG